MTEIHHPLPKKPPKKPRSQRNRELDEQIEDSFPASDPPSHSGGGHIGGPKRKRDHGDAPKVPGRNAADMTTPKGE